MSEIKVSFFTNRDHPKGYRWVFPEGVLVRPMIGDYVESECGTRLKVCSVTHCISIEESSAKSCLKIKKPCLKVELT